MKKTLSILLIVAMLLSMIVAAIPAGAAETQTAATTTTATGSTLTVPTEVNGLPVKTWDKPWETESGWTAVGTTAQLDAVGNNQKVYLTADIEMNSTIKDAAVSGTIIDGNGHTLIYGDGDGTLLSWAKNCEVRNLILKGKLDNGANSGLAPIGGHNGGGHVGKITLTNVWCDVDVTVRKGGTTGSKFAAGGVVMNAEDGSSFTDVIFTGSITKPAGDDVNIKNIGGIVGNVSGNVTFTRCYVTTAADKVVPTITVNGQVNNVGGLVGNNSATFVDCYSGANITVTNTNAGDWQCIGGIIGRSGGASNYTNCKVEGSINYTATANAPNLFIGGLSGIANGAQNATNCTVSNNMTIAGKPTGSYCAIGGYNGWSNAKLTYTNCVRGGTLDVNMNGWKATDNSFGIGGFIGYTNNSELNNCATAVGAVVKVTLSRASDCTTAAGVGGIYGRSTGTINNVTNNATVSAYGYVDGVGGIVGYTQGGTTINNSVNNGKVVTYGDAEGTGGIIGLNGAQANLTNVTNNADVESTGTKNIDLAVGGMIGKANGANGNDKETGPNPLNSYGTKNVAANGNATFTNCANNGNVKVETTSNKAIMAAAFVGENDGRDLVFNGCTTADGKTVSVKGAGAVYAAGFCSYSWGHVKYNTSGNVACVNNTDIKVTGNGSRIGAISGYQWSNGSLYINNTINKGDITVTGNVNEIGSFVAAINRDFNVTNSTNEGDINVGGNFNAAGGIAGYAVGTTNLTNVTNKGDLVLGGTSINDWKCIGGIIGRKNSTHTYIGVENAGNITFNGTSANTVLGIGGFIGVANGPTSIYGSSNTGNLNIEASTSVTYKGVAGFVGWNNHNFNIYNSVNNASISYKGNIPYIGGFYGYNSGDTPVNAYNCINMDTDGKGINVEYTGTSRSHIGGIIGYTQHTANACQVINCVNSAPIKANASTVIGGIVGIGRSDVINAVNTGKMTGSKVAGIMGEVYNTCIISNTVDLCAQATANGGFNVEEGERNITVNYANANAIAKKNVDAMVAKMEIFAVYAFDRLEAEVEFARTKLDKGSSYVTSTWNEFIDALENAEQYYKMDKNELLLSVGLNDAGDPVVDFVSQADINGAYTRLNESIAGLVNKAALPAYLENLVAESEEFAATTENIYLDEYWNVFTKALADAKALLTVENLKDQDSDYINGYVQALKNALDTLKNDDNAFGGDIWTAEDFAKLDGKKGTFNLKADITVKKALESFNGIIYGNGHTITLDGCGLIKNFQGKTTLAPKGAINNVTIVGDAGEAASIFGIADGQLVLSNITVKVEKLGVAALFESATENSTIALSYIYTVADAKFALVGDVNCEINAINCLAMCKAEALVGANTSAAIANSYLDGVEYYTAGIAPLKKTDADTFASGMVAYNINDAFGVKILVQKLGTEKLPVLGKVLADGSNEVILVNGEYKNRGVKIDTSDIPEKNPVAPSGPNLEELKGAIAIAEALLKDMYTEDSWAAFQTVLANAKKALTATEQSIIDDAFNALTLARVSLAKKAPAAQQTEVDYTALEALIAQAKALVEADYTEDTWATLKIMLAMAEAAKTAEDQATVNSAKAALNSAIVGLNLAVKDAPVADDNDDDKADETPADEGCGSVVGGAAVVAVAVLALGAGVTFKKKED